MIQVFGTKKCNNTGKALRFFKERGVKIQFINLAEKGLSKGELLSISKTIPVHELINTQSKEYEKLSLKYMKFNIEETLLDHPLLLVTPIVRFNKHVAAGYKPEAWTEIVSLTN